MLVLGETRSSIVTSPESSDTVEARESAMFNCEAIGEVVERRDSKGLVHIGELELELCIVSSSPALRGEGCNSQVII